MKPDYVPTGVFDSDHLPARVTGNRCREGAEARGEGTSAGRFVRIVRVGMDVSAWRFGACGVGLGVGAGLLLVSREPKQHDA